MLSIVSLPLPVEAENSGDTVTAVCLVEQPVNDAISLVIDKIIKKDDRNLNDLFDMNI